jgi:enterochelin esterase-like enzyme
MRLSNLLTLLAVAFVAAAGCSSDSDDAERASEADASADAGLARDIGHEPDAAQAPIHVEILAQPMEWGLFPEPVEPTEVSLFADTVRGEAGFSFELPAGVHRIVVSVDRNGERVGIDTGPDLSSLVGTHQLVANAEGGLVFNPARAEFEAFFDSDGAITIRRGPGDGCTDAMDAPGHVSGGGAGPGFDALLGSYDPVGADREAVFDLLADLHRCGGSPIATESGLLFVAPGQAGDSPELVGTFNNWQRTPGWELRQLVPGLFARYVDLDAGVHAYKIAYGDSWTKDQANRHIEWDGIAAQGVGDFNSLVRPEPNASRLVLLPRVDSTSLENRREVYVYLPPGYSLGADHPLLVVHDGNESIVRAQFHEVLDTWSRQRAVTEQPIVAFVALPSQDVRMSEYTFASEGSRGPAYADFLALELVPRLKDEFRVVDERGETGLLGASLGGLISYFSLSRHPDVFGYAAGMSSSFFWADGEMLRILDTSGCFDASFYLDSGSPNDNFEVTQQMRDLLDRKGCRYRYVLDEGGTHEWWKWKERLPGVLDHFAEVTP